MQCSSCGMEIPRNAAYCPSCGTVTSDKISHPGILPDDPTTISSPHSVAQESPISTNNPYEQNPYSLTIPSPPPPPRHRARIGLAIGILALVLILVSGISIFVWFNVTMRATDNTQMATATETTNPIVVKSFDTSFYYRLTNSYLGINQSLAVRSDGSNLLMMAQTGNDSSQFWELIELSIGKYRLHTASLGRGFSLDVINGGVDNTPRMFTTGNYTGQVWSFVPWGDGTYKLINEFTGPGKSLDTYSNTHEPFLGTGDHSGQHWTLTQLTKIPT